MERLQAGQIAQYDTGARYGECLGALGAVRRFIADRGLLAELTGRAIVSDLIRRYGADYVTSHPSAWPGMLGLAADASAAPAATSDANSPEGVGAKGEPGGWTGGRTRAPDPTPEQDAEHDQIRQDSDPWDTDDGP